VARTSYTKQLKSDGEQSNAVRNGAKLTTGDFYIGEKCDHFPISHCSDLVLYLSMLVLMLTPTHSVCTLFSMPCERPICIRLK